MSLYGSFCKLGVFFTFGSMLGAPGFWKLPQQVPVGLCSHYIHSIMYLKLTSNIIVVPHPIYGHILCHQNDTFY